MLSSERFPLWSAVSSALGEGATVITPGRHASQRLRSRYDQEQRLAGHTRWSPPALRSWTGFLEEMWRDLLLAGHTGSMLLSGDQERLLWQRVVEGDAALETLSGSGELAELAQSAWNRICTFRVSIGQSRRGPANRSKENLDDGSTDAGAFARWVVAWRERCERDDLVTMAELPERLAAAIASEACRPKHTRLALTGFDDLSPAQQHLLETLRTAGTEVTVLPPRGPTPSAVVARAAEQGEELQACARWCVARARAGSCVAVVAPELDSVRPALGRVLQLAFAKERRDGMLFAAGAQPFAFGTGGRLAREPLVVAALDILRLGEGALPLHEASRLLQSRYFAARMATTTFNGAATGASLASSNQATMSNDREQERAARAECDAFGLRKMRKLVPEITLPDLLGIASDPRWAPRLSQVNGSLRRMQRYRAKHERVLRSYDRWAEWMRGLLRAAGWGASPAGTSQRERQASESFAGALDALAALSFTGERIAQGVALDLLVALVDRKRMPVEIDGALIQIITPEDAAGSEFDALWCLRAGETSWPSRRTASPLLSRTLQRNLRMPGTDRAQEAAATVEVFRRLQTSASEVVFSYAEHIGEATQRVVHALRSATLPEFPVVEFLRDASSGTRSELAGEVSAAGATPSDNGRRVALERVADTDPIAALPDGVVHGGAGLLATQAACGFRAFAEHRLVSSPLDEADLGMDARRTGEIVHLALQQLWTVLGDRATLSAMTTSTRATAVERAIDDAIASVQRTDESAWSAAFVRVERKRLRRLLDAWLRVELTRPDFAVRGHEMRIEDARIGPLRLSLRVDRVDEVDGSRVLIDYKTGEATRNDWQGDRPDAPQLPLYAVLSASAASPETDRGDTSVARLGAVAFAKVRRGRDMRMEGLADRKELLPGGGRNSGCEVEADLAGRVEDWKATLEALAIAFANGDARVNPKSYPETCRYCKQRMLCRLDMRTLEEDDASEFAVGHDGDDA